MMEHVERCARCAADWREAEQPSGGLLPPARVDVHLSESELQALADYRSGPADDRQRQWWAHTLVCRDCHAVVAALRAKPEEVPEVGLRAEDVWRAIQARRVAVTVVWAGAILKLQHTIGWSAVAQAAAFRDGSEDGPVEIVRTLDGHKLVVTIVPADAATRRSRIGVRLVPADIRARVTLSRDGDDLHDVTLAQDQPASLPAVLPGRYELVLKRDDAQIIERVSIDIVGGESSPTNAG